MYVTCTHIYYNNVIISIILENVMFMIRIINDKYAMYMLLMNSI